MRFWNRHSSKQELGRIVISWCWRCDTLTSGYTGFGYTTKAFKQDHICLYHTYNKATAKAVRRHSGIPVHPSWDESVDPAPEEH